MDNDGSTDESPAVGDYVDLGEHLERDRGTSASRRKFLALMSAIGIVSAGSGYYVRDAQAVTVTGAATAQKFVSEYVELVGRSSAPSPGSGNAAIWYDDSQ